jgi:GAF domain-containing protein/nitrogen-specific signal transduction histidine kinase
MDDKKQRLLTAPLPAVAPAHRCNLNDPALSSMPEWRTAPRALKPAETMALILGLVAVLGNLGLALIVSVPPPDLTLCLIWLLTLTVALNLNIAIDKVEINFAAFFVLSAFMLFGSGAAIGIFVSSLLLGELVNHVRQRFRAETPRDVSTVVNSIFNNLAVDGLGLLIGSVIFYAMGGVTPFMPSSAQWLSGLKLVTAAAVLALEITHFVVSFGVGAWLMHLRHIDVSPFATQHWLEITILGAVPTFSSFALAIAALNMPSAIFLGACAMLLLSIGIAHNLSRARVRLERRVRELHSLATIGQVVADSLELPEVLLAIHQQTQELMDARNFYIALYDDSERRITFPLAYENGVRVTYSSRLFGEGFTEYIILTRRPLLIKGDVQEFARQIGQPAVDPNVRSWLGVPIAVGENVLGVMTVQSRERANSYDESHRDILISIAAQAATAIRNSQLYMSLRHQTNNLFIINSVLTAINSTLQLDEVLNIIVTSLPHVMNCQKAAIFLADDTGRTATLAASHNLSADFIAQARVLPIGPGGRMEVIATGQPLIVSDLHTYEKMSSLQLAAEAEGFRALAEVPLWAQDKPIGSLTAYYAEPHVLTPNEIEELTAFANQAAVAVANARLYARTDQALTRRIEQIATLQQIGLDLVSSLDLDQVMQHLLERAAATAGATLGIVGIWDEEHAVIRTTAIYGYPPDEASKIVHTAWPVTAGLIGRAIRTGQSFFVTDVRTDPDYVALAPATRSEMVVLLRKEDRIVGVINLESSEIGRFDQASLDFSNQLATQAVIALENAQLYHSAQSRLREMSILYEVGQRLTSILNLPQLGKELTYFMARALNMTFCGLQVFEPATGLLHTIGQYFSPDIDHAAAAEDLDDDYRLADYPELQAAIDRHDIQITYRDDTTIHPSDRDLLERHHIFAMLNLPLVLGRELIGVVKWGDERANRRFGTSEIQFAKTLANQATIAVHNARLFEERARRISTLSELYQASAALSTSVELEEVLRRVSTVAREISRADAASLYLYDEHTDSFTRAYAIGVTGDWSPSHLRSTGMTRRVVKEGKPVLVLDTHTHPEVNPHTLEAGIGSLVAVPLISQGQPVGVMYVGSFKTRQFDEGDVQIISALANQAAAAISNARLFSEVAEKRDQLQAILDSADDGMLIFEPGSRIVMVNPCLETMWNVPHGWLNDRRLMELLNQPEVAIAAKLGYTPEALRQLLERLSTASELNWNKHIYQLPGHSPARYVERTCLPVLDAERVPIGWMMLLRDVTEELEVQRIRDDLTNTIVHDLRSPLSSILGSLYFLEELAQNDQDSPAGQALAISIRSTNKLMQLVNSLLDIARLSTGQALVELRAQHLESVLDAAVEYLLPLAVESEIDLVRQVEPDLPLVLIDEDKINRVLVNLIDNALKFTPRGGRITVSAERWVDGAEHSLVRCIVRDNGPGIPLEYRTRIFDRFVQIANRPGRRRGTGIGLNFCQLAVEAHGGRIWVEEGPGGGSEFSFTLQAVAD